MWRIALLAVLALSLSACASHGYGPHPRHGYYYQTQPYGHYPPVQPRYHAPVREVWVAPPPRYHAPALHYHAPAPQRGWSPQPRRSDIRLAPMQRMQPQHDRHAPRQHERHERHAPQRHERHRHDGQRWR